jgi:4-aminobutyrate aminotransferase-like enzyme
VSDTSTGEAGAGLPELQTTVPGPRSISWVETLARVECPGITARRARAGEARGVGRDPIVWERALGANVWDADGNRYVDLTGAFGVALIGHGHPRVVAAVRAQSEMLLHGMGDVYPNTARIALMAALAAIAPGADGGNPSRASASRSSREGNADGALTQCILASSGSEAVEIALKTAALWSGRPGVLAFWGGYHGLSYGALAATAYKADFRRPFAAQLGSHVRHLPYGCDLALVDAFVAGPATGGESLGAILVEPIQGRGGEVVPPAGWLAGLRDIATRRGLALVCDEVYTGLGRTGTRWAADADGVVPDVVAIGKALGGGLPIGACLASPHVMRAWGESAGEAIHTSTFLGNPVTAAAALATLEVMAELDVAGRARAFEAAARAFFEPRGLRVRGRGAMLGLEVGAGDAALLTGALLKRGYLVLPSGVHGDVLGLTPPVVLTEQQRAAAFQAIAEACDALSRERTTEAP